MGDSGSLCVGACGEEVERGRPDALAILFLRNLMLFMGFW